MVDRGSELLIDLEGVGKSFGEHRVLKGVDL